MALLDDLPAVPSPSPAVPVPSVLPLQVRRTSSRGSRTAKTPCFQEKDGNSQVHIKMIHWDSRLPNAVSKCYHVQRLLNFYILHQYRCLTSAPSLGQSTTRTCRFLAARCFRTTPANRCLAMAQHPCNVILKRQPCTFQDFVSRCCLLRCENINTF